MSHVGGEGVMMSNLFEQLPDQLPEELFTDLIKTPNVRIERILSQGHSSPASGWYEQDEHEWVIVLRGTGRLGYEDGSEVLLQAGDYVNIPAGVKHKVLWTAPEEVTVWLAVFYL